VVHSNVCVTTFNQLVSSVRTIVLFVLFVTWRYEVRRRGEIEESGAEINLQSSIPNLSAPNIDLLTNVFKEWDSSVGLVIWFESGCKKTFLFASRPGFGPHPVSYSIGGRSSLFRSNATKPHAYHSPPSSAKVTEVCR
jgi:hypothetical protein